jgi:CheY-like chemotaxis protein
MMVDSMPQVLVLADDLMFVSRVREAARGLDLEVKTVRQPPDEVAPEARLALVDLDRFGDPAVLGRLRGALGDHPLVGFVSHVHADRARQARDAGCTRVLARSAFVQELPAMLAAAARRSQEVP